MPGDEVRGDVLYGDRGCERDWPCLRDRRINRHSTFETDRTLLAKVIRHSRFFVRYLWARCHRKCLDGLMAAIEGRFSDSKGWIVERRLELRKAVGPLRTKDDIHWDAPIVVLIIYRDEKGNPKEACGMSFYIENNSLCVEQLQGGKSVTFPRRYKVWPQLFLKSCIAFAQTANFDQVRLAKAETLYTYRWPELGPNGIARSEEAIEDHRKRMKLRYDETARICGFRSEDNWLVWNNPARRYYPNSFTASAPEGTASGG